LQALARRELEGSERVIHVARVEIGTLGDDCVGTTPQAFAV